MPGLCICLPPEQADLSGFADGTAAHPIAPGPLLAEVVTALAGGDGAGLAQVSEDCLFSVLSAGRRMSSWGTWLEFAAMRELAVRHPALDPHARKNRPAAPGRPVLDQQNMLGWLGPASAGRADRGEVIMPLDRVGRNYFAAC
jgi:hypothetical protein